MRTAWWTFFWGLALGLSVLVPFSKLRRNTCYQEGNYRAMVTVVVAATDLKAGALVSYEDLSERTVPEQFVASGTVTAFDAFEVVNQRLLAPLAAGDPIRFRDVAGSALVAKLPNKARAATIDVDPGRAVDGQVKAGDHVDVLASLVDPQTNERVVRTLIQNVIVLGVTHRAAPQPDSVSLLVLPEEAEALLLTQDLGHYALTLRNPDDVDVEELPGRTTVNTLLSGERWSWRCCHHRETIAIIRGDHPAAGTADAGPSRTWCH